MSLTIPATTKTQSCYHCGDDCIKEVIESEGNYFCCHGCRVVYELLSENDMCTYYDLEKSPGNTTFSAPNSKYEFLDNESIVDHLLDYASESINKITLKIPSIHCSSCIWLLENLHRLDESILSSKINFSKKLLSVDYDPGVSNLRAIATLLHKLGYEPEINLSSLEQTKSNSNHSLYLKIGIAGFCFGNIMLLSFPDYLGMELESNFQYYFGYLSFLLSIPVLVYCARDYFTSAYKGLLANYFNIDIPIALGMITLFVRSAYEVVSSTGSGYFDSFTGLTFFLLIGKWIQSKTYEGLSFERNYKSYFPLAVTKVFEKHNEPVLVENLKINDEIIVRNGEIIPTDAVLLSDSVHIDYSFVTGESAPVKKKQNDKIYAGGKVVGTAAHFNVIKDVSQNYLTQLWNNSESDQTAHPGNKPLIDLISRYFTFIILTIAIVSAAFWYPTDPSKSFFVFTAVLIIACPCALTLATPFTLNAVMNILGRSKLYLKNTGVIERIWKVDHIIFDKTGTITNTASGHVMFHGEGLTDDHLKAIKLLTQNSTHPYSQIITNSIDEDLSEISLDCFEEIPGNGVSGVVGNINYSLGSMSYVQSNKSNNHISKHQDLTSKVHLSIDHKYIGFFSIENEYRTGLKGLIVDLSRLFKLSVLSGDNAAESSNLARIFPEGSTIRFNQKPHDKLTYIQELNKQNDMTMMLGDGLNDSGALNSSEVGIAVTDDMATFTPASDAILFGNHIQYLSEIFRFISRSKQVLFLAFFISFLYNIIGLGFAVTGNLTPVFAAILMPLSSITVVFFSTFAVKLISRYSNLP